MHRQVKTCTFDNAKLVSSQFLAESLGVTCGACLPARGHHATLEEDTDAEGLADPQPLTEALE